MYQPFGGSPQLLKVRIFQNETLRHCSVFWYIHFLILHIAIGSIYTRKHNKNAGNRNNTMTIQGKSLCVIVLSPLIGTRINWFCMRLRMVKNFCSSLLLQSDKDVKT